MRRYALWVLGMAVLIAVLVAGAATAREGKGPVTVQVGEEVEATLGVSFAPRALSKVSYTPIRVTLTGEERAFAHPPPVREVLTEFDKNLMIRTEGLPVCNPRLQTGINVDEACKAAIVGAGEEKVQVAYPENTPITVPAKVQILNGGERAGAVTMYVYGYFANPIGGSLLTKVVFTRIHRGRFGWLVDAKVPQIAGGFGSVVDFTLAIGRRSAGEGKQAVLSAKCTDGKLRFHFEALFEDGSSRETETARACTPRG
jgi:hypothetical protein